MEILATLWRGACLRNLCGCGANEKRVLRSLFVILINLSYWLFVKMTKPLSYWLVLSYWAQRSIHKFEVYLKFCGFFAFYRKLKMTMFEIFRFVLTHSAQNDKGAPSLRAVFAKTAWQSKKAFRGLLTLEAQSPLPCGGLLLIPPPLRRGLGVGFKTHHTTFERACVPLLGWRKLHPFFMLKILCLKS